MNKLLLLIALVPLTGICQNTEKPKKISLGISFSPDYCYRVLKPDSSSAGIARNRDTIEIPKFGYTTGINIDFRLHKRFSLETGIHFSDKGEKTKKCKVVMSPLINDLTAVVPDKVQFTYHYYYLDIPVKVKFYLLTKKARLYLAAGVSANVYLRQKTNQYIEFNDGHKEKDAEFVSTRFTFINLAVTGALGFSYDVTDYLNVAIEPVYRRSVTSIIDAPIRGYLYSIGISTGISYKF